MVGKERFKELITKYSSRPIILHGDPDTDGLISLLFMCQFCEMLGLPYQYHVNDNRCHGFNLPLSSIKGCFIIAADFSMSRDEIQRLVDNDVAIISTDHHQIKDSFIDIVGDTAEGIVINNQYSFEPEEDEYLSGAGVFYELVCSVYPEFASKEREALVGVTLLSDVRAIENNKARKYLSSAYNYDTQQEGYINYLVNSVIDSDFGFGSPKLDRNLIDFYLSPKINSMLRFNRTAEAIDFVLGKGLPSSNYKKKQQSLIEDMKLRVRVLDLPNIAILAINELDFTNLGCSITGFIGLFCSNYKDSHNNKSTLGFVFENGKITRASFRGKYDDIHYRVSFSNLGYHAEGHPNAFGLPNFEPDENTWIALNDLVGDLELQHESTVNIIESSNLALIMTQRGMNLAYENLFVRDMYRSYIRYTGSNIRITRTTYKMEELTVNDLINGIKADVTKGNVSYRYLRDTNGNPIPKYIEYMVDGRKVKSFGVPLEDGLILPILEKGYVQLYVRSKVD